MEPAETVAVTLATPDGRVAALLERRGIAGGRTDEVSKVAENLPGADIAVVAPVSVEDDEFLLAGGGANGCMIGGSAMKEFTNK